MNVLPSDRGGAPTLAVFMIFVIVSSGLVLAHLQSMGEEEVSTIQLLMASDVTQATISSMNAELNDTLYTATTAAMYDVGIGSGVRENVENYVVKYLNNRIGEGWNYPNLDVEVPLADENSVVFEWHPDGSVTVKAYLNSKVEHVKGPTAYGTFLHASPYSRFRRIKHVAEQIERKVGSVAAERIPDLEEELDDNYECEGIDVDLIVEGGTVRIRVSDTYGAKVVIRD